MQTRDGEDDRRAMSLNSIAPQKPGRRLVICSIHGCAPCKTLISQIAAAIPDREMYDVSTLSTGDVVTRTHHIRLGARTYPTVLMVEDGVVKDSISGGVAEGESVDVFRYLRFLEPVTV